MDKCVLWPTSNFTDIHTSSCFLLPVANVKPQACHQKLDNLHGSSERCEKMLSSSAGLCAVENNDWKCSWHIKFTYLLYKGDCLQAVSSRNQPPRPTQPSIPVGSVNEHQLYLGMQRQAWLIPIAGEHMGVQVKLREPLRTLATTERFWGDVSQRGAISTVCTFANVPTTGETILCSTTTQVRRY